MPNSVEENYKIMFTNYPDIVNVTQLTKMLGIGTTLAYKLLKNNQIKAFKVGREYKIPKANIISYLLNENNIID